ncbi:MAG: hypothetical protein QOE51_480 [Actinoplanes sp.]|nr:hypothetical protein [Actinoplanes sp.]
MPAATGIAVGTPDRASSRCRSRQHARARPSSVMVWTLAQAGVFLDYAQTHDLVLYPMFLLILHRGLRRGEAVGLRVADVDLDTASITIA